ncbi:hypothetical protein FOA43_000097 [Brettanomyces nanus]|uniref:Multiple RNA-binding domain-containing protein 1 n=1 Tax=Eeniella nana TaxID=13502 RepID=A0A875RXQ2_EENNA|nr:uncharacterized protein FOA43_000097 [Brettanomyces nanus]QPG72795.1 hypothetical protein FOA43_000097 [Brettanomyces nanus]
MSRLRHVFSEEGSVTDVKLIRKRNGESRRFAFIGFRSMEDAEGAVKSRNGTFIDTAKIDVQLAKISTDPTLPLSWREKRKLKEREMQEMEEKMKDMEELQRSVRSRKKQKKSNGTTLEEKIKENPELQQYLETMKSSGQGRSWNNDEVVDPENIPTATDLERALAKGDGTLVEATEGATEGATNEAFEANSEDDHSEVNVTTKSKEEKEEQVLQPKKGKDSSDMDDLEWFKTKRVRIPEKSHERIEEPKDQEKKEPHNVEIVEKHHPTSVKPEAEPRLSEHEINAGLISKSGRLFLRNILYSATESDFQGIFSKYGELEEVHVAVDSRNGSSKGFAYVQFKDPDNAIQAYEELDGSIFQGRLLHIIPAKPKKENKLDEFALQNMPLKKQKLLKRKIGAAKQQFSWNSLYMNNDAVLESVASNLGITKLDLIDPENSNSAVKQALAEAHVIGDVRKYFEGKGVDLLSFNQKEKDDKVILVKNFQHGITKEEIGEKFAQYGKLTRILMPPAGTIAIVEFRDTSSGKIAFNRMSFKRLGKSILYLEKGPKGLFSKEAEAGDVVDEKSETSLDGVTEVKQSMDELMREESKPQQGNAVTGNVSENESEGDEEETGPTVSVFVKNFNFATTTSDINNLFKPLEGFVVALVKTKPDSKHPGKMQSMGFGFVEFRTRTQALAAIRAMDGYVLDGHKLQMKLSTRTSERESGSESKKRRSSKSPKIIVKNLPFEATRKDVLELFNSFGNLQSVRVPKKFDKSARGFAFVEFSTVKEAENVMDQLQGVHLLGRRLVLDFAEKEADNAEEEIERMTRRAKKQTNARKMADIREGNSGKRKLDLEELDE